MSGKLSSPSGIIEIATGTNLQPTDNPTNDNQAGSITYLKTRFPEMQTAPTKVGQVMRNNSSNKGVGTYPQEFIREFTARQTFAVGDIVAEGAALGTYGAYKVGRTLQSYASTQLSTATNTSTKISPIVLPISSSTFIALWSDDQANGFKDVKGALCTIATDGTISAAATVTVIAGGGTTPNTSQTPFAACVLDSTHFVVAWLNTTGPTTQAVRCTISGGTFTVGAQQASGTLTSAISIRIAKLTSTSFLLLVLKTAAVCTCAIVSAASDTFTYNTAASFPGAAMASPVQFASDIAVTSSSTAFVVLVDSTAITPFQITLSGTTVTIVQSAKNAAVTLSAAPAATYRSMATSLSDDSKILTCVIQEATAANGITVLHFYTQTGTSFNSTALGAPVTLAGAQNFATPNRVANATIELPVAYGDDVVISGGMIFIAGYESINAQNIPQCFVGVADIAYSTDLTTPAVRLGNYGTKMTSRVGRNAAISDSNTDVTAVSLLAGTGIPAAIGKIGQDEFAIIFVVMNGSTLSIKTACLRRFAVIGFALDAGNNGDSIRVQVGGICSVLSALTEGAQYYASDAGALTTRAQNWKMGQAISSTEVLMTVSEVLI